MSPLLDELEATTRMTKVELFEAHEMSECVSDVNAVRELDASFAFTVDNAAARRDAGPRHSVPEATRTRAGRSPQTGEPAVQLSIVVPMVRQAAAGVVGP